MTIRMHPQLAIQQEQVNYNRGTLLTRQSLFDLMLTGSFTRSRSYTPLLAGTQALYGVDSIATGTASTAMGVSKLFRSGVSISPTLQLNRTIDNTNQRNGVNQPQSAIQIVLPLLRNRGRAVVASGEIAASLEVDASIYDLSQLASQSLATTAVAYWNYLGAVKTLEVEQKSEQRGEQFLNNVQALASADVVPRIQVQDALANLANRRASRIGAEQSVILAQQQLAIAMGVNDVDVMNIAPPGDPFPEATDELLAPTNPAHLRTLIELALSNRADYLGAKVRTDQQKALLAGTQNRLRPQLDLTGTLGYTGIESGRGLGSYLNPLFQSTAGPNAAVALQYQFPTQNRAARGALVQNQASLRQQDLHTVDVARQIASSVVSAANALNNSVLRFRAAQVATAAALEGRQGEDERLRQGVGSVLDVLQTEDRYVSVIVAEIQSQVAYATAIANFRLATGTYLNPSRPVQEVRRDVFFSPISQ